MREEVAAARGFLVMAAEEDKVDLGDHQPGFAREIFGDRRLELPEMTGGWRLS
ncbi:hypothetical protein OVY29_05275 [Sphingopyxis sp. SE2]|uniref:hypothetical protein n=1 Tax=Sphingopyxis sp. SE2 TaxID=1586240 RepID=UPI0028C180CB|nr:hypothetical protein [Sphingopyxis sp. SE2]MDT7528070.1 hypothetical protein [Sphingopyxis sp. SE2]